MLELKETDQVNVLDRKGLKIYKRSLLKRTKELEWEKGIIKKYGSVKKYKTIQKKETAEWSRNFSLGLLN